MDKGCDLHQCSPESAVPKGSNFSVPNWDELLHRQLQTLSGSTQVVSHDILALTIHVAMTIQEAIARRSHLLACSYRFHVRRRTLVESS